MLSPVFGLRPIFSLVARTSKVPRPKRLTRWPESRVSTMWSRTPSRMDLARALDRSWASARVAARPAMPRVSGLAVVFAMEWTPWDGVDGLRLRGIPAGPAPTRGAGQVGGMDPGWVYSAAVAVTSRLTLACTPL